jgi:hypothetical protein
MHTSQLQRTPRATISPQVRDTLAEEMRVAAAELRYLMCGWVCGRPGPATV